MDKNIIDLKKALQDLRTVLKTKSDSKHTHKLSDIEDIPAFGLPEADVNRKIKEAFSQDRMHRHTVECIDGLGSLSECDDTPEDGKPYIRQNGAWVRYEEPVVKWGSIIGDILSQDDLVDLIDHIKNFVDKKTEEAFKGIKQSQPKLGSMAEVDDVPQNGKEYVRVKGAWKVIEFDDVIKNLVNDVGYIKTVLKSLCEKDHKHNEYVTIEEVVDLLSTVKQDDTEPVELITKIENHIHTPDEIKGLGNMAFINKPKNDNNKYVFKNGAWVCL